MKQATTLPMLMGQAYKAATGVAAGKKNPVVLKNVVRSLCVCVALWLIPGIAKADTPIPTSVVSSYDPVTKKLTLTVSWYWSSTADNKFISAAVFADLNGDGIAPTFMDNPATYTSGGNAFPPGLFPRDEFLGQLAVSNIEGSATSALYPGTVDNTDNGIASGVSGVTPSTPRVLFPYGLNSIDDINSSTGTFTLTYSNVTVAPTKICVVLYDVHTPLTSTGGHSVLSAGPNHNDDNSFEKGNDAGTVSCTSSSNLQCASDKTEGSCQTQAAIDASYNAWLSSVTASGCNGVLTNNSTGAPSACGGSKTVTWTYTQNGCPNQAPVTTCTATFTVTADVTPPVFTSCPSGSNLGCNPSGTVPAAGTATATDNCANSTVTVTNALGPVVVNGNQRSQTRTYTATDACGNSSTCQQVFTWTVCVQTNPDFNVTYVNVPVPGDVHTNDMVPAGTTYGTPVLSSSPAGSTQSITMNSSGTYTFSANKPGVYVYNVPYCAPGAVAPCPTEVLTITVLEPTLSNNPPVANTDIAYTKVNTSVVIKTLANDKAGNPGGALVPSTTTVTVAALHGTSSINSSTGDNTYTPNAGYTGWDVLTYQVCDNSTPSLCASAKQYIYIGANGAANTTFADDDYAYTPMNVAVSGNVKTNDTDPEGNTQTVTAQTTTVPGKGTLVLTSNGNYTFTPVTGFTGPVSYVYTTCDNGAPQACASATLYVLVSPPLPLYNPDFNVTYVNVPVSGSVRTNDVVPAGTSYGTPVLGSSPAGSTQSITMNTNGTYTFTANKPGVYTYNVPVCVPAAVAPCPTELLTITVLDGNVMNNPPVANTDIAYTSVNTPVLIKTLANDKAGNPGGTLNPASVTVTVAAAHGTSSINAATGDNTYTPAAGFTGWDVLTYQVCDNNVPAMCATAKQYIYVGNTPATNSTFADDDYAYTPMNVAVSGNVKTNDTDPEGNTQTVIDQTMTNATGTFTLATNGNFTFTPAAGFTGPTSFVYQTCDNGTPQACAFATVYILVSPPLPLYNPDFNVTYVDVPVNGNVRTNDFVPAGTTYGVPALTSSPAGSTQSVVMNSNGSYTFVANKPGVYTYNVPVCVPGQAAPCPTEQLTVTVLDALISNNPPVANPDIAFTKVNTPVLIYTLANDKAGNPGGSLNPASVTVTVAGLHGASVIDPLTGNNVYTPQSGYTGWDVLTYQVCDNSVPALCATSQQYVYILPNNVVNTTMADDDYAYTQVGVPVSGNVKSNDTDPEGNTQTVTAQTTTVPGKGTLVLNANGTFTFTPAAGFTGPVNFVYTTCDNGIPQACASATLYVLVAPPAAIFNPDFNVTYVNVPVPGDVHTNDVVPAGTTYGTPTLTGSPAGSTQTITMNPNGTYTFVANTPGVYTYDVPVCVPGQAAPCPTALLTITVLAPNVGNNPPVANTDIAITKVNTPVVINTLANDKAGNPGGSLNPASVTVTVGALHGSSSINPATGENTYTPNAGYTGWDVLTYQVCDNSVPTPLCATAKQYIYVWANGSPNTTLADDDYAYTNMNTAVSGNVKTNDSDPEGNTQTVTAQTTTVPGKGTLVLNANGTFTFTPVNGFTGPVSFVYTTCDNGVPVACASATLYVLVAPPNTPDFTPSHDIDALTFAGQNTTKDMVINITEVANGYSTGQVQFKVRKISAFTITVNPAATTANVFGGTAVNNNDWIFTEDANFITATLKPGVVIPAFGLSKVGVTITRNPGVGVNTTQNITTTIVTGSGGDTNSANNQAVTSITAN